MKIQTSKMNTSLNLISILSLLTILVTGCKKEQPSQDLAQDLHGKYLILSVDAGKPVDVNFDGIKNSDLLKEIPSLKDAYLELIMVKNSPNYTYSQFWQNQSFLTLDGKLPTVYDPKVGIMYLNQPTVASFTISQDGSKLNLSRDWLDEPFPLPESVEILQNQDVKVIMQKSMYTKSGWEKLKITVVYHKFTSEF